MPSDPAQDHPDREPDLVARICAGDESAFAALFAMHYEGLWALVNGYVDAPDVAEEIVQDIFVRIWAQRARWEVHGSVRGYLYSAARSRALDYLRHQRVVRRWEDTTSVELGTRVVDDTEALLAASELSAALDTAIAQLSPALREVLVLRARHHLTYPEIARLLQVSPKAVETRVTRAFKALRELLGPYIE